MLITERDGSFIPERSSVGLEIRGVSSDPKNVSVNGGEADWSHEEPEGTLVVSLPESAEEVAVEMRF